MLRNLSVINFKEINLNDSTAVDFNKIEHYKLNSNPYIIPIMTMHIIDIAGLFGSVVLIIKNS